MKDVPHYSTGKQKEKGTRTNPRYAEAGGFVKVRRLLVIHEFWRVQTPCTLRLNAHTY